MEYRDISRSQILKNIFILLFFFGKYHLKNREISGIFFGADLRFFLLGTLNLLFLTRYHYRCVTVPSPSGFRDNPHGSRQSYRYGRMDGRWKEAKI